MFLEIKRLKTIYKTGNLKKNLFIVKIDCKHVLSNYC